MANEVFISYSRRDLEAVERILSRLRAIAIDPWIDFDDIRPATEWKKEILVGVQACHNFLFCISPNSVKSDYCKWELDHALLHNKRIIPLIVEDCNLGEVPRPLLDLQLISLKDFDKGFGQLMDALNAPIGISLGDRLDSLVEIETPSSKRVFYLYRNKYFIGRNPSKSISEGGIILVNDQFCSRGHLTLEQRGGRWRFLDGIIDESIAIAKINRPSKYGVWMGSDRIPSGVFHPLRHGDVLRISPQTLVRYLEITLEPSLEAQDDRETFY